MTAMNDEKSGGFEIKGVMKLAVIMFIAAGIISSARMLVKYNEYRDKIDELSADKVKYEESIERIRYELEQEFDDEYVEKIAKEKLNLCRPDEVVYYNGLE